MTFKLVKFSGVQTPLQWASHREERCGNWERSHESQNKWKKKEFFLVLQKQ